MTTISTETLTDLEYPSDIHISPCGKHVVYAVRPFSRKDEHNVSSIWLADTDRPSSARQLTSGSWDDCSPRWSPDGSSIAFLSDRGVRGKSTALYLLYMTGRAGSSGEPVPITPATNKQQIRLFDWSPSASFIAFISADEKESDAPVHDPYVYDEEIEYRRLRFVHVVTRKVTTLVRENIEVYKLAWSPDSKRIVYAFTDSPENENDSHYSPSALKIVSIANGSSTPATAAQSLILSRLCWSKDGKYIYFISHAETNGPETQSKSVYAIDAESRSPSRLAFGESNCATQLYMNSCGDIYMGAQNKLVDSIYTPNFTLRYNSTQEIHDASIFRVSENRYRIVTIEGTVNEPLNVKSRLFVQAEVDADAESTRKLQSEPIALSAHNSGVSTHATWIELKYGSKDGAIGDLDGWFFAPESIMPDAKDAALDNSTSTATATLKPPQPLPTLVWLHGGPYSRCSNTWDSSYHQVIPKILSTGKYGVLAPNYRGGSGRGQKFAMAAHHGMGTVEFDDVISCIDAAIASGLVDKHRIVVAGWSQGGFLSYTAAVRNAELSEWKFKAVISGAGVTDWDVMAMTSDATKFETEIGGHAPWHPPISLDQSSQQYAKRASPIRLVAENKDHIPPLLMLHGQNDVRVPVTQAIGFRKALRHNGIESAKYQLVTYPREPHKIRERAHVIDLVDRVLSFVDLHVG